MWRYLSVLSAAINAEPDHIQWLGVLIEEGGIMFDTDVLAVRSFAPLCA